MLGLIHQRNGLLAAKAANWELARIAFTRATELRPTDADTWNNLGVAWTMARKGEPAVTAIDRALELQPAMREARINLGSAWRVSRGADRVPKAREAYEAAFRLYPKQPELLFNLGLLYLEGRMQQLKPDEAGLQKALEFLAAYRAMLPPDNSDPEFDKALADAKLQLHNEEWKRVRAE